MTLRSRAARALGCAAACALAANAAAFAQVTPSSRALLDRIWAHAAAAERRHTTVCGSIVETRTSRLLTRPLVIRGTFCVGGVDRFRLDYEPPAPLRILFNRGILNVSADGGAHTEAMDVDASVSRAQDYFSGPESAKNLERDFRIEASETPERFVMRLTPVSGRVAKRATRIGIELGKADGFPRRITIEGRNGVTSEFQIAVDRMDAALGPAMFDVYDPRPAGRRPRGR
jgi:hypothetical protein